MPMKEGTLYYLYFIDVFTRKIIGRSMSPRMRKQVIFDSFLKAFGKVQTGPRLIMHTDQDSQYIRIKIQTVSRKIK
ncbi:DDE-type integrase/transposase/recombinase [Enterococcus faecalis]|uniref:DDE-type integrase/transposase/recombinase n=1 Tax=Enterococcus faecalis TaxID=1351 RepID=UPI0034639C67